MISTDATIKSLRAEIVMLKMQIQSLTKWAHVEEHIYKSYVEYDCSKKAISDYRETNIDDIDKKELKGLKGLEAKLSKMKEKKIAKILSATILT